MSEEEDDYEYEYDEDDNMEEENNFEYTDNEEEQDDVGVALENAYYNAKGLRETSVSEAAAALEQVIAQEREQLQKEGKQYGPWSYKAMKQLVKLHLRVGSTGGTIDQETIMKHYRRLLECISSTGSDISQAAVEKGINGMLERVASLNNSNYQSSDNGPQSLALAVYDATLAVFHPQLGPCKNERLWFKTNLKYGQLLYEMNETAKLQLVLKDLLQIHGELPDPNAAMTNSNNNGASGSTNSMEIYALQIQLYSRQKDNKKLRETFQKAMNVRGGIPHPRTIALIQELGGKMHMSHAEYEEAGKTFFQAFKSYDEAGDHSRLRCLKYLVLASMLHASSINPFDSQEARPYRDDPEIVAMTNLVQAFHNNEIQTFEKILRQNQGRVMDDEFIREHIEDLLRTIRTQVLRRVIRPYKRISLAAIAVALNDIPVKDVENLLVNLILEGSLDGTIDLTEGVLLKQAERGGGDSSAAGKASTAAANSSQNPTMSSSAGSSRTKSQTILKCEAMDNLIGMLDDLSTQITSTRGLPDGTSGGGSGMRGMVAH
jgi:COP9 signalosome complex subunit 2